MSRRALFALAALASLVVSLPAQAPPRPAAVDPAREKRLEWFREAKYGLFIHWGLYAIPAGQWNGKRSLGLGELIDIGSKGGNYLLNVGPTAEGVIPPVSQDILRTVGRWLQVNGEAVYGAGAKPFGEELGESSARGAKDVRGDRLVYQQIQWRSDDEAG